jgi:cytochrome P450
MSVPARAPEGPRDPIAAVTHPDPYPYYARLVATRPFHRDDTLALWVACSAAAVTEVLGDPACLVRPPAEPVPRPLLGSAAGSIFGRLVRMNDGERHAALKPAVSAVTSRIEAPVREQAKRWAEHLVETLEPARDRASIDPFAFSLSAYVLAGMLGVSPDRLADTTALVGDFARSIAPAATGEQLSRGAHAAGELIARFEALLGARGGAPAPTLLGDLDREVARAGRAEPDDVVANGIGFLSQAYEATAGLIGNTLVTMGRLRPSGSRPAQREELAAIVREVVRYDPPVQNTRRFVARDTTIGAQVLKAGDVVLVVVAAANRDPLANPEPSSFDPARTSRQSFTFGAGPHACPGEAIATAIAEAGVAALLASGVEPARLAANVMYRQSGNTRVPIFNDGGPIG